MIDFNMVKLTRESEHEQLSVATDGKTKVNWEFIGGPKVMLVVMKAQATEEQVRAVCERVESLGYRAHAIPGAQRTAIGVTGNKGAMDPGALEEMSGVQEVIQVSKPYKLVSRDAKEEDTIIRFAGSD